MMALITSLMAFSLLPLAFLLCAGTTVRAELYVAHPLPSDSCAAGQPCSVEWLDNGELPLLGDIGITTVGLYHGTQKLVQTIEPVDVSKVHSLTFIPNARAGPNSDTYYICFTSTALKSSSNTSDPYQGFSPPFKLTGMQGSFTSPVASLTSTLPIPSSVANAPPASITSTITIGSAPPSTPGFTSTQPSVAPTFSSSTSASSSGFVTSVKPSASSLTSTPVVSDNASAHTFTLRRYPTIALIPLITAIFVLSL